VNGSSGEDA